MSLEFNDRRYQPLCTDHATRLAYLASIVGLSVPLALTIVFASGTAMTGTTRVSMVVLWITMLAGFFWSALSFRKLHVSNDSLRVQKGLPPFRREIEIPFRSVRRLYIRDYSNKLVLELDDSSREVVANAGSALQLPLAKSELAAHEPGGAYQVLKTLKTFLEGRLKQTEGRSVE